MSASRSVNARGVTIVPFDRVNFTVTAEAVRPNSTEAKDAVRPTIDNIQAALTALESEGVKFVEDRTTASMNIAANTRYNHQTGGNEHNGYTATYSVTVQTEDVDRASEILDVLTNVQDAQVSAPDFRVDNVEQHFADAFEDGFKRALARFQNECRILGKSAESYSIREWSVRYDDSQSAGAQPMALESVAFSASMKSTGGQSPVQVISGNATIYANVTLSFGLSF